MFQELQQFAVPEFIKAVSAVSVQYGLGIVIYQFHAADQVGNVRQIFIGAAGTNGKVFCKCGAVQGPLELIGVHGLDHIIGNAAKIGIVQHLGLGQGGLRLIQFFFIALHHGGVENEKQNHEK